MHLEEGPQMNATMPDISNDPFSVRDRVRQTINDQLSDIVLRLRSALDWGLSSTDLTNEDREHMRSALNEVELVLTTLNSLNSMVEPENYPASERT